MKKIFFLFIVSLLICSNIIAEDGYRLWLRYDKINNPALLAQYKKNIQAIAIKGSSPTLDIIRTELKNGLSGLLDSEIKITGNAGSNAGVWICKVSDLPGGDNNKEIAEQLGKEGYKIFSKISGGKKLSSFALIQTLAFYTARLISYDCCKPTSPLKM